MHNQNVIKIMSFLMIILIVSGTCVISVKSDITAVDEFLTNDQKYDNFSIDKLNDEIISHAEYEQVDELIITWPGGTFFEKYFLDIIRNSEDAVLVRINVGNLIFKNNLISKLNEEQIPLDNLTISISRRNSIWCRDYGPFFIEKNDELTIVDFNYLGIGRRIMDNLYPTLYGLKNNMEFDFWANFALCIQGGNYMSDGQGLAMLSADTLEEDNPKKTIEEMGEILKEYLGLNEVLFLESQADDGTGHIDMYSKLINENTVIVGQWDESDINFQILENNTQLLINNGYNVIRVPMLRDPDEDKDNIWTYTNSLIINGTNNKVVLVPQYNTTEDSLAISIYEQSMPDYEIIGINCNAIIDYLGAIHCTTMTRPLI